MSGLRLWLTGWMTSPPCSYRARTARPASRSFPAEDVPALLEIFEHRLVRTEGDEMKTETIGLIMGQRFGFSEPE